MEPQHDGEVPSMLVPPEAPKRISGRQADQMRRFTVWLSNAQHYQLRWLAYHEERPISDVVRELIARGLREREKLARKKP